jgi:surface protein
MGRVPGEDFSDIFYHVPTFNEDIQKWDVSNAELMTSMFEGARSFNQDISSWNTSNVINMDRMFFRATSFDQDVSSWTIPNVVRITSMFKGAIAYNEKFPSVLIEDVPLKRQRVLSSHDQGTTQDDEVRRAKNTKKAKISGQMAT